MPTLVPIQRLQKSNSSDFRENEINVLLTLKAGFDRALTTTKPTGLSINAEQDFRFLNHDYVVGVDFIFLNFSDLYSRLLQIAKEELISACPLNN